MGRKAKATENGLVELIVDKWDGGKNTIVYVTEEVNKVLEEKGLHVTFSRESIRRVIKSHEEEIADTKKAVEAAKAMAEVFADNPGTEVAEAMTMLLISSIEDVSKYSFEFKKKVVKAYLNGEGGYGYLSKTYGVPAQRDIEKWVHNYQKFGDEGLIRSRKNQTYSFEKKLSVVELYLSSEISYQDLALQEGITNPSMIVNWVKRFRVAGPDALRPHKKGRRKTLEKPEKKSSTLPIESPVDTSAEHVKELEDELLKLRIENAFLKELRRLRLEDEAKMRERRESSTASEDSSN